MVEETEKQNLEEKPQTVLSHLSDFLFSHYIKLNSHVNLDKRGSKQAVLKGLKKMTSKK